MFSEAEPLKILKRMKELDLLKFIHPGMKTTTEAEQLFNAINETLTWFKLLYLDLTVEKWFVYFLGLFDYLKPAAIEEALERLSAPVRIRERVKESRKRYTETLYRFYKAPDLPPSRVYDLLRPLDTETIILMMAKANREKAKKYISLYLTHLRDVKVALTGDDLKAMGIPPGPRYKKILAELLDAKLDNAVKNREQETAFVKSRI
jgi:tRNA nucleotidyltransferase (CCA-adding enzyme)